MVVSRALTPRTLSDLSDAIVALVRRFGRAPTSATSWQVCDSCVLTALEGFLTPEETALDGAEAVQLASGLRSLFGDAIAPEYLRAAEDGLGQRVIGHRSEVLYTSGVCLEMFLLAPEVVRSGAPLLNAGWHRPRTLSVVRSIPDHG